LSPSPQWISFDAWCGVIGENSLLGIDALIESIQRCEWIHPWVALKSAWFVSLITPVGDGDGTGSGGAA